jgi:hypothetical protein
MKVYLTFDYELFFGEHTGTVQKCMIQPTEQLLSLSQKYAVPMTFFVDIGFIIQLEKYKTQFPVLEEDYQLICKQLKQMQDFQCDIQLHIHPHWEKSYYDGKKWVVVTKNAYKLSDFPLEERDKIIRKYKEKLDSFRDSPSFAFRAGGWCIQPFDSIYQTFKELNIRIDSSVFAGGHFEAGEYSFDFRSAPKTSHYRFEQDVCKAEENGFFEEYAIASHRYSPLFYWRLYILGRLFPTKYKMVGDGTFLEQPGRKKEVLTNFTHNHVSSDGFYSTLLQTCTQRYLKNSEKHMVIIGHPKGNTIDSVQQLSAYIQYYRTKVEFSTFNSHVNDF